MLSREPPDQTTTLPVRSAPVFGSAVMVSVAALPVLFVGETVSQASLVYAANSWSLDTSTLIQPPLLPIDTDFCVIVMFCCGAYVI